MNVGQFLKEQREAKGITLEQLANETKISLRHLQAIEADRFEEIPGKIYVKGFLKLCANALGISTDELLLRYETATSPLTPVKAKKKMHINLPKINFKIHVSGWMIFVIVAIAVIVAAFIASR